MKHYSVAVSVAPGAEPLTLGETKKHLRVDADITDQDALITALIQAAREWVENYCRRSLVKRTLVLRLDCFPGVILLPRAPVLAVESVKYTDADGNLQTVSSATYQVDIYSLPGRIVLPSGGTWPTPKIGQINAVQVTYTAGYAEGETSPTDHAANVPAAVKAAMKLLIGHWYENREAVTAAAVPPQVVPFAVKAVLAPFEIRDFRLE